MTDSHPIIAMPQDRTGIAALLDLIADEHNAACFDAYAASDGVEIARNMGARDAMRRAADLLRRGWNAAGSAAS